MQPQQPVGPPPQTPQAPQPLQPAPNYEFIMNPEKPSKPSLFNASSLKQRLMIVVGGAVILVIILAIAVNLLSGSSNFYPSVLAVVQEQQEIIHLTTTIGQNTQSKLNTSNSNLAMTLQLSVTSSQSQLLTYLQKNGHKVSPAQLNLKVSTVTDQQLTTATQAGTYDATFDSIIQSQLHDYQQALNTAYIKDTGAKGRALLKSDFTQTQLLLASLNPSS